MARLPADYILSAYRSALGWSGLRKFSLIRAAGMLEGLWTLSLEASLRGVVSRPMPGPVRREPGVSRVCVHTIRSLVNRYRYAIYSVYM